MDEMQTHSFWTERIDHSSIFAAAHSLGSTIDLALASKKQARSACAGALSEFYSSVMCASIMSVGGPFEQPPLLVNHNNSGVRFFVALRSPDYTSPVRYLKEMRQFAESLLEDFSESDTPLLAKEQVEEIFAYLDERYHFSKFVFDNQCIISIVGAVFRNMDGLCTTSHDARGRLWQFISLFPLLNEDKDGNTLEYVLFHELGHALHAKLSGDVCIVPDWLCQGIEPMFPTFRHMEPADRAEIVADVFAMGLMTGSPFEDNICGRYKEIIHPDDMAWFHQMVEIILSKLKEPAKESCCA